MGTLQGLVGGRAFHCGIDSTEACIHQGCERVRASRQASKRIDGFQSWRSATHSHSLTRQKSDSGRCREAGGGRRERAWAKARARVEGGSWVASIYERARTIDQIIVVVVIEFGIGSVLDVALAVNIDTAQSLAGRVVVGCWALAAAARFRNMAVTTRSALMRLVPCRGQSRRSSGRRGGCGARARDRRRLLPKILVVRANHLDHLGIVPLRRDIQR